jgi:hypothetical protein
MELNLLDRRLVDFLTGPTFAGQLTAVVTLTEGWLTS